MFSSCRILVSRAARTVEGVVCRSGGVACLSSGATLCLALCLTACGQQGPLFLPTEPAAANRATLLQTLIPRPSTDSAASAPAVPASAPGPTSPTR